MHPIEPSRPSVRALVTVSSTTRRHARAMTTGVQSGCDGGHLDASGRATKVPVRMPIYAYECQACHARSEHIQKLSDPPLSTCETCGGRLRKLVTAAAFHLKGGGWYKDGYASARPSDSANDSASDSGGAESSGKSDASTSSSSKVGGESSDNARTGSSGKTDGGSGGKADSSGKAGSGDKAGGGSSGPAASSGGSTSSAKATNV